MSDQDISAQPDQGQTIIVNQQEQRPSNGIGIAGFVLAIIAIFLGWLPFIGWIIWLLGLIFSFCGIFKEPKGLAIAGLVISLLGLILITVLFASIGAAMAL